MVDSKDLEGKLERSFKNEEGTPICSHKKYSIDMSFLNQSGRITCATYCSGFRTTCCKYKAYDGLNYD